VHQDVPQRVRCPREHVEGELRPPVLLLEQHRQRRKQARDPVHRLVVAAGKLSVRADDTLQVAFCYFAFFSFCFFCLFPLFRNFLWRWRKDVLRLGDSCNRHQRKAIHDMHISTSSWSSTPARGRGGQTFGACKSRPCREGRAHLTWKVVR
jgi:hypothetical protein